MVFGKTELFGDIADNSQIHATKVLQKHYETFIHRNIYFENIRHPKENAGET